MWDVPFLNSRRYSFLLALLVLAVFGRVVGFDVVNFDDPFYIRNVYVLKGLTWEGIRWAFAFEESHFGPLYWLSYMLDRDLFGGHPAGYHLTNLVIHLINTLIFYHVLSKVTHSEKTSFFAAVLFAVHPLRVETVAWVADRKDLLAVLFALLCLEAYRRFVASRSVWHYVLTAVCFVLSLLSKPVLVALPFALLLMDFWPLKRLDSYLDSYRMLGREFLRLFVEKIPLLLLTGGFIWLTFHSLSQAGQIVSDTLLPLHVRLANIPVSYMQYLVKFIWPTGLMVLYPLEVAQAPVWKIAGSWLVLILVSVGAVWQYRARPYLLVGWFWFLGNLVPMIGIMRVGPQEMADRYTYFPLIGLFLIVAWGLRELALAGKGWIPKVVSVALVAALITVTSFQLSVWKNSLTLFTYNVKYAPDSKIIQINLGYALMTSGDLHGGIRHFKKAIALNPTSFIAWMNLGTSYRELDQFEQAVFAYSQCLKLEPDHVVAHFELGKAYHKVNNGSKAIEHTVRALAILKKDYGLEFDKTREAQENLKHYYKVYNLKP